LHKKHIEIDFVHRYDLLLGVSSADAAHFLSGRQLDFGISPKERNKLVEVLANGVRKTNSLLVYYRYVVYTLYTLLRRDSLEDHHFGRLLAPCEEPLPLGAMEPL